MFWSLTHSLVHTLQNWEGRKTCDVTRSARILIDYVACLQKYVGADAYEDFYTALPGIRATSLATTGGQNP